MADNVNHPPHYQGNGLEAIQVIEAFGLGFCLGNAVKYILRAGKKGDAVECISKARWYLDRFIQQETAHRESVKTVADEAACTVVSCEFGASGVLLRLNERARDMEYSLHIDYSEWASAMRRANQDPNLVPAALVCFLDFSKGTPRLVRVEVST